MLTIRKKLAEQATSGEKSPATGNTKGSGLSRRPSFRTQLLTAEASELGGIVPKTCTVNFTNPDKLSDFEVIITPNEGYWKGGNFTFKIRIPEEYNNKPPDVHCETKLWHPNINETGEVCLSILRETSIDGTGWSPARRLKDVVFGLNSLFTDLLNFDDPLNLDAAEHFQRDKVSFSRKVQQYVRLYAS